MLRIPAPHCAALLVVFAAMYSGMAIPARMERITRTMISSTKVNASFLIKFPFGMVSMF